MKMCFVLENFIFTRHFCSVGLILLQNSRASAVRKLLVPSALTKIPTYHLMSVPKVIIDTDAGLDDALAIFMALAAHKRKEIEVIAITTVNGNTEVHNVNNNVLRILKTAGLMKIPVYSGATKPLINPWKNAEHFHGLDGFGDANLPPMPESSSFLKPQHASLALLELVSKYPNEIMLAAIGPLTNLALAIKLDPTFTSRLSGLYVMGGNTTGLGNITSSAEFNFFCDPEAAKIVLEETKIPIHLTPWEICLYGVNITYAQRKEMGSIRSPAADLMNQIEAKLLREKAYENWITCDQLALAWLIDNAKKQNSSLGSRKNSAAASKKSESYLVKVTRSCLATLELQGSMTRGQLVINSERNLKSNSNMIIMTNIDINLYHQYLRMAFGAEF